MSPETGRNERHLIADFNGDVFEFLLESQYTDLYGPRIRPEKGTMGQSNPLVPPDTHGIKQW